jgi:hypothetical protein
MFGWRRPVQYLLAWGLNQMAWNFLWNNFLPGNNRRSRYFRWCVVAIDVNDVYFNFKLQLWKNPLTGKLHLEVHPCGAAEVIVAPLPKGASRDGALFPDGAHLTDLKEVRELLYKLQRPGIAPRVSLTLPFHLPSSKSLCGACLSS